VGRDAGCRALIALVLAAAGACGSAGGGAPPGGAAGSDGGAPEEDATIQEDAGGDDAVAPDAAGTDIAAPPCSVPAGEIINAACNDIVASGPCVAPLMVDEEPPAAQGGALIAGTYDLTERTLFTFAGGAAGPAGEPLAETIALSGAGTDWSLAVADLTAATATRQSLTVTPVGSSGQLRTAVTCPGLDATDAGTDAAAAGAGSLYFTAGNGTLTLYRFGSSGPVRADTYVMR
jgi:hypothetical protein